MDWDYSDIESALKNLGQAKLQMENLINDLESLEVPTEIHFDQLAIAATNQLAAQAKKDRDMASEQIIAIYNNLKTVEYQIGQMNMKFENDIEQANHMHIGDNFAVTEGIVYYETGRGEGRHGTVGSERDAGDDFHIDRVAFYIDGQGLVANIDDTGADIDELRAKYAEEYGVELSDVEMSFCLGKGDGLAAGWIMDGDQLSYDDIKSSRTVDPAAELKSANFSEKSEIFSTQAANLDEAMQKIEEKYNNIELDKVNSQVAQAVANDHSGENTESVSFWATVGESSINAGVGILKVPLTAVTGTVDISTNLVTFGHGTSLTKYEWESLEELADIGREDLREMGGVNMDDYKTLQEVSGALVWVPAVAAAAAPAAGSAASAEIVAVEGGETLAIESGAGNTLMLEMAETASSDVFYNGVLVNSSGNIVGMTASESAAASVAPEIFYNGVLVDSAGSTIAVTASENAAISLIPSEIAVDVAAADTSATVAKVIIGTEAGALGVGGTAAVLSDKG